MELQALAAATLARTVQRLDPLVLMVDLNGQVVDRVDCTNERLPQDLRCADSLGAVLSAPVLAEWHALLRESLARREGIGSMAIIDGRGHALAIAPNDGPGAIAMIAIFPSTLCTGSRAIDSSIPQVELMNHEWGRLDCLSRGQLDTLRSVTLGFTNDQIAERVHRTKRAIEWHIRFLNQLLGVHGREDLATIGREAGLCCFSDEGWAGVMRTRPSRRDSGSPEMPEPKPLRVA
ncbi:MAG: hypothetical protein ACKPEA_19145 [Planctomycetota bacterium]